MFLSQAAPVVSTLTATTTALTASATTITAGSSVTFTATVTPASGSTSPTGTVTFMDGTTTLGTGTLASGMATYTTNALSTGSHSVTAVVWGRFEFLGEHVLDAGGNGESGVVSSRHHDHAIGNTGEWCGGNVDCICGQSRG